MENYVIIQFEIEGDVPPGLARDLAEKAMPLDDPFDDDLKDPEYLMDCLDSESQRAIMFRKQAEEKEAENESLKRDRDALARSLRIVGENGDRIETGRSDFQPLLTKYDAAAFLKLAPKTIDELARTGKLDYIQLDSKNRRFTMGMLDDFIRRNTVQKPVGRKAEQGLPSTVKSNKGGDRKIRGTGETDEAQLRREMRQSWL